MKKIISAAALCAAAALSLAGCGNNETPASMNTSSMASQSADSSLSSGETASSPGNSTSSTANTSSENSSSATGSDSSIPEVSSVTSTSVPMSTEPDSNSEPAVTEPQWTERAYDAPITFYITQNNVKARSKPIPGSDAVKTYSLNTQVQAVAETDTEYFKLDDESYVHIDYMSRNPVEIKDTSLKVGDKNSKGYTIIGITSDGTPYIGIDENYEKKGTVIIDYMPDGKPAYTDDPEKKQELYDSRDHGDITHIIMGH